MTAESQGGMIGNDLVVISGFAGRWDKCTAKVYAYNTMSSDATTTWQEMDNFPIADGLTHGASVIVRDILYICGGYVGGHPGRETSKCFAYNHSSPIGMQWRGIPDLPQGRAGGALFFDSSKTSLLYATGATRPNPNDKMETVDHTDAWELSLLAEEFSWIDRTDLPYHGNHVSHATVTYGGIERHYIIGGQVAENEKTGNLDDVYEWDAIHENWIQRSSLPFPRGHASSSTVSYGCGIILAGGAVNGGKQTKDIIYYGTDTDKWTSIGVLPFSIRTPVCAISGDYLYCQTGKLNRIFSYRRILAY
jgi:hypothetical protein